MPSKAKKLPAKPKPNYTIEEKAIIADRDWWCELLRYLPWTLFGFTYRMSAVFFTDLPMRQEIHLTGDQRDQILEAIERKNYA